jgi:hypothetical protein
MDRTRNGSHQADGTAAIDKPDPIRGKDFTESPRGGNKAGVTSLAGSAVDADAFDNAHYLDVALGGSARQGVPFPAPCNRISPPASFTSRRLREGRSLPVRRAQLPRGVFTSRAAAPHPLHARQARRGEEAARMFCRVNGRQHARPPCEKHMMIPFADGDLLPENCLYHSQLTDASARTGRKPTRTGTKPI